MTKSQATSKEAEWPTVIWLKMLNSNIISTFLSSEVPKEAGKQKIDAASTKGADLSH